MIGYLQRDVEQITDETLKSCPCYYASCDTHDTGVVVVAHLLQFQFDISSFIDSKPRYFS